MSVQYTILGFLSAEPLTGYDLKKKFISADFLHWSGNNNQIYTTLVELHHAGLVHADIEQQGTAPVKKRYTITEKGVSSLRAWLTSPIEAPLFKNMFIVRLAWADMLDDHELLKLINDYQFEVETQLTMCTERIRRHDLHLSRTPREDFLWQMIWANKQTALQGELNWLTRLRNGLGNKADL